MIPENIIEDAIAYTKKYLPNFQNPKTIQEKIAWLKTFDITDLKTNCTDKLKLHDYSKKVLGVDLCVPVIKTYKTIKDIDLDELPNKFVFKCNHGCKYNFIVKNKKSFDFDEVKRRITSWMSTNFGLKGYELQYYGIERKIYTETYINTKKGDIVDYKFLCFNGRPTYIQIISDRSKDTKRLNYYDMDFKFVDISRKEFPNNKDLLDKKPEHFEAMIEYAKLLSKPFSFVRVDFYDIDGRVYLGELTFSPGNAKMEYENEEHSIMLGNMLKL